MFLGSRDDVTDLLAVSDIFAFSTTRVEGFGIALIEAMAAGLPILASDVPACREVLRDGEAGLLINSRDVHAWTKALSMLMYSYSERKRLSKATQSFVDNYSLDVMSNKWWSLINSVNHNSQKKVNQNNLKNDLLSLAKWLSIFYCPPPWAIYFMLITFV